MAAEIKYRVNDSKDVWLTDDVYRWNLPNTTLTMLWVDVIADGDITVVEQKKEDWCRFSGRDDKGDFYRYWFSFINNSGYERRNEYEFSTTVGDETASFTLKIIQKGTLPTPTTAENLNRIIKAKSDIKQAIENKGVTVGDITIDGYAAKINEIPQEVTGGKWVVPNNIRLRSTTLETLDVNNWDLSSTINISYLFAQNEKLVNVIGINNWDVRNLKNTDFLFGYCTLLETMDLSNWNILEELRNSGHMFYKCENLYEVNISNVAKNGTSGTMELFYGCTNLQTVYMRNWDLSNVSMMGDEFYGCTSLKTVDMENTLLSKGRMGYSLRFNSCTELENLVFGKQAMGNWDFSNNTKLTKDSLLSILNGLKNCGDDENYTLTLGTINLAKLSDDEKAIATDKGWTLA